MGYLSHVTGQDIENIIQAGQGLAYVVYPHAVTTIPGAPFWAICFFFMMVLLGIDSTVNFFFLQSINKLVKKSNNFEFNI